MIHFKKIAPHPALQKYIAGYWRITSDCSVSPLVYDRIFPDSFTDIVVNFGDPFVRMQETGATGFSGEKLFVAGIMKKPRIVGLQGKTDAMGISFKAEWASAFLSVSMNDIADANVSLDNVLGRHALSKLESILEKESEQERLKAVEGFLCGILSENLEQDPVIHGSIRCIHSMNGQIDLGYLESLTGYSGRQIERKFLRHVGVGPKYFAKIIRFRRALAMLERPGASLVTAAFDAGYSDQAHFTREIRDFTGLTPGMFLRKKTGDVVFFQD